VVCAYRAPKAPAVVFFEIGDFIDLE
jgi:hypothetical protein